MKKQFNCKWCGTTKNKQRGTTNTYCSNKCQHDFQFNSRYVDWCNGKIETSNVWLRKALSQRYGAICSVCKISNWQNKPIVLEVEHKDGNSGNNILENLCLICPNCHSQTPTYKGANKGNGRYFRRVRYKEGKSY